ncbi:MAG: hypothetical protein IPJ76_17670 [Flavobacteriales bacterium]|nr:MAG: hypothetical protein IPJ76_17670 [Flavobacteriales bacterium]
MPRTKKEPLFSTLMVSPTLAVVRAGTLKAIDVDAELLAELNRSVVSGTPLTLSWSTGPAGHLIVLNTAQPIDDTAQARAAMHTEVVKASNALAERNLLLLPAGAHPFLAGSTTTAATFPGADHPGWRNNQCLVVKLPFTDDELAKVLAAVRVLLPILPALSAASPIIEGRVGPSLDMRLVLQSQRFSAWSALAGPLIPEAVFTRDEYYRTVFTPIVKALADAGMHDTADIMAMDSRSATASFDPDHIELKVLDGQESIGANMALAELVVAVLRKLCNGRWISTYVQRAWDAADLTEILQNVLRKGAQGVIDNQQYLRTFGCDAASMSAGQLWKHIIAQVGKQLPTGSRDHAMFVLREGCLAQRILGATGSGPDERKLVSVYERLRTSLISDEAFRA